MKVKFPTTAIIIFFFLFFLAKIKTSVFADEGLGRVITSNNTNHSLEYYYYIPQGIIASKPSSIPLIVMVPGLSGKGEFFVSEEFKKFADEKGFVILAPSFVFDEQDWQNKTSYQYPSVWSGEALIQIINNLKDKFNLNITKLYLFGFSAGAQFALRFALWRPDICAASAGHGSGSSILPERYVAVKFFVTVGENDTSRIENAERFYQQAKNLGIEANFKTYPIGHELSNQQIRDSLEFFSRIKAEKTGEVKIPPQISSPDKTLNDEVIIYLKNGWHTQGRIKEKTDDKIILELRLGNTIGTITFSTDKIKSIEKIK